MRLAVFTNMFPSRSATYFARDMRALIEAGIELDVFAIYPREPRYWRYVPEILNERLLPRERVHHPAWGRTLRSLNPWRLLNSSGFLADAAAITYASLRCGPVSLAKSLYVVPLAWAWARDLGRQYDHVLAYWGNYPGTCAYLFHRVAGRPIPFSLCLHAGIDLYGPQPLLRQKLLYADSVITISEFNRRFLQENYGDVFEQIASKIHVNYRGLDLEEYRYQPDHRRARRVLAAGRFSKEKGYDCVLRAVAELQSRGVDLELELIGDGPERHALTALAKRLRITHKVTFRGWLLPSEVRQAMLDAAVFVNPSRQDALPTVIEEATALGTPVVASRVQGAAELLDDGRCGILVPPQDVRALADAIATLLANPALRSTYADLARKHAEQTLDLWRNGARLADHLKATRRPRASCHRATAAPRTAMATTQREEP